jgi:8-oxo-dGTP pyrophosphatase MutT (NUDIX family)
MNDVVAGRNSVQPWETLGREESLDCRIFTVEKIDRQSPDGSKRGDFYIIDSKDWVNVVAITVEGELVLIRQYRHGSDELTLEIPGGILDEGESPIDAARRELLEETGYEAQELQVIGRVRPNPAFLTNWAYTVLATGVRITSEVAFDEHEEIDVEVVPLKQLDDLLRSGAITHALVIDALMWFRLHGGM